MATLRLTAIPILGREPNSSYCGRPRHRVLTDGSYCCCCKKKKKINMVWWQSNTAGNVKSTSSLYKRNAAGPTVTTDDGNSDLSPPRGTAQQGSGLKETVPSDGTATTVTAAVSHEGIGIVRFLRGKGILITGATGFLTKVLLEKILRTEPDVNRIFLLIRAKSNEAAMERLKNDIINTELFKCLRETRGKSYEAFMLSKLVPVAGNVREANLGMEADLADEIAGEVDIIVNSAANTTFDERYDVALDINTRGPFNVLSFSKRCKQLKLFLHISTAYVNGQRQGRILEKPFCLGESIAMERLALESSLNTLSPLNVEAEFKMAWDYKEASQDNRVVQTMTALGLERARMYGWQDTYAFTKAMGEMLINNGRGEVPVTIVRPSIIESTCKEPFPGWIEGNRMLDPIFRYYGKGQLTGFLADPKVIIDIVPADMVVNVTLAAMAKHGSAGKPGMNIYHVASSVENPLELHTLMRYLYEYFKSSPYMDPKGRLIDVQPMKLLCSMDEFSTHLWNDVVQRDVLEAASHGKNSLNSQQLGNIYKKLLVPLKHLVEIYRPYTTYGGRFDNTNTQKLMEDMSEDEKKVFGFDAKGIHWKDYISSIHMPGLWRYVLRGRGMRNI